MTPETRTTLNAVEILNFSNQDNWLTQLEGRGNQGETEIFRKLLVPASQGMGYCMDEKPAIGLIKDGKLEKPENSVLLKPAMVGGAAGWVVDFILIGKSPDKAVEKTEELYEQMNWGEMRAHIDDEHGHIQKPDGLIKRKNGCGFFGFC